jgi:hypothetical protein
LKEVSRFVGSEVALMRSSEAESVNLQKEELWFVIVQKAVDDA